MIRPWAGLQPWDWRIQESIAEVRMADPVNSRVRQRRTPTRNPAAAPAAPQRAERTSATALPQEHAMERWLRDELHRLHTHILEGREHTRSGNSGTAKGYTSCN